MKTLSTFNLFIGLFLLTASYSLAEPLVMDQATVATLKLEPPINLRELSADPIDVFIPPQIGMSPACRDQIPQDRRTVWSPGLSGLTSGGIPSPKVSADVTHFGADGNGSADDTQAIINAIKAVKDGGAVFFPAGTYRITKPIRIYQPVVLRGAGAHRTTLVCDFSKGDTCLEFSGGTSKSQTNIRSGYNPGSYKLKVDDVSFLKAGDFVNIWQSLDTSFACTQSKFCPPAASWAKDVEGQILQVDAVHSSTKEVTFKTPIRFQFKSSLNPKLREINMLQHVGVEQLKIRQKRKIDDAHTIIFNNTAFAWVTDVESEWSTRYHIWTTKSYGCEIKRNHIHNAYRHDSGGHGYGVKLDRHTSDCLVEDNVFDTLRHAMMVALGANGNVFAYNYSTNTRWDDNSQDPADISLHGHQPAYNLFEGNWVERIFNADYWGPSRPGNTFLRNVVTCSKACRYEGGKSGGLSLSDHSDRQTAMGNEIWKKPLNEFGGSSDNFKRKNYYHGKVQDNQNEVPDSCYLLSAPAAFSKALNHWPITGPGLFPTKRTLPAKARYDSGNSLTVPQTVAGR